MFCYSFFVKWLIRGWFLSAPHPLADTLLTEEEEDVFCLLGVSAVVSLFLIILKKTSSWWIRFTRLRLFKLLTVRALLLCTMLRTSSFLEMIKRIRKASEIFSAIICRPNWIPIESWFLSPCKLQNRLFLLHCVTHHFSKNWSNKDQWLSFDC